jgi:hypothetical protein
MQLTGLFDLIGEDHVFPTIVSAVRWFQERAFEPNKVEENVLGTSSVAEDVAEVGMPG